MKEVIITVGVDGIEIDKLRVGYNPNEKMNKKIIVHKKNKKRGDYH